MGRCALLAVAFGVWVGCTVTPENYEFLSLMFDGVPDPNAPIGSPGTPITQSPTYTIHQPVVEGKCVDCHGRRFNMTAVDASVCLECHETVTEAQPLMHGPVAAMACLWCHTPHESPYASLLKQPPRELCSTCHTSDMLGTAKTPEHKPDSVVSCLECHSGHGGTSRYFLHGEALLDQARAGRPHPEAAPDPTEEPRPQDRGEEPTP
jgi:predicted CXXCH cytochrome family protein